MFACIAEIHNWAKVWIAYTEYTISNATIVEEMNTLWDCRYESGIPKNGKCSSLDTFTVSENMRMQDTWFLLVISAIVAHLRLVGETSSFKTDRKPVVYSRYHHGSSKNRD